MAGRKFYCICDANCKFETMTKEQIIDALAAAATTAYVKDGCLYIEAGGGVSVEEDAAFITQIKEGNAGGNVSVWVGTEAEFNAIAPAVKADSFVARIDESGKVYICKNDSLMELLKNTLHEDFITVGGEDLDAQRVAELNSHDYMAGALKQAQGADSAYVDKPVKVCYQTANPPALAAGSQLAIWTDKGDGAAEIQPISLQAVTDFVNPCMRRDFAADVDNTTYTTEGNKAKIYTATVCVDATGGIAPTYKTVVVDYKTLKEDEWTYFYDVAPTMGVNLSAKLAYISIGARVNSITKTVSFKCEAYSETVGNGTTNIGSIKKICGYY